MVNFTGVGLNIYRRKLTVFPELCVDQEVPVRRGDGGVDAAQGALQAELHARVRGLEEEVVVVEVLFG